MQRCSAEYSIELKHLISLIFVLGCKWANRSQERFCHESCPRVQLFKRSVDLRSAEGKIPRLWYESLQRLRETYEKLHLGNLFIYLFHELYDEIHQLMLQHLLRMEIRYQERDVVSLSENISRSFVFPRVTITGALANLYRLSS